MPLFRYKAIPMRSRIQTAGSVAALAHQGERRGDSASEVRAALRSAGLQVISLRPIKERRQDTSTKVTSSWKSAWGKHLRKRRSTVRAEWYDGVVTMLDVGLPLPEVLTTIAASAGIRSSRSRMITSLCDEVQRGSSLGAAMQIHPDWFSAPEVAMVEAGQVGGTLSQVLRTLSQREEQAHELGSRLMGALAYPALVSLVALGVTAFLATRTLPSLADLLTQSQIEIPLLTQWVMFVGHLIAIWTLPVLLGALVLAVAVGPAVSRLIERLTNPSRVGGRNDNSISPGWKQFLCRCYPPQVLKRKALGECILEVSLMLRSGVPLTEALRTIAPTTAWGLGSRLLSAAQRLESGEDLASALDDPAWFDPAFRRLLSIAQTSGELDDLLERLGCRLLRQASRLIDRVAAFLEPASILTLAFLIGLVVMGAILPILKLQEIIH